MFRSTRSQFGNCKVNSTFSKIFLIVKCKIGMIQRTFLKCGAVNYVLFILNDIDFDVRKGLEKYQNVLSNRWPKTDSLEH